MLELTCFAKQLGTTSFTIATEFRIAGEELIVVMAETVYVLVEAGTLRKIPLPPDLRAALQAGAPGAFTDHAGYLAAPNSRKPAQLLTEPRL